MHEEYMQKQEEPEPKRWDQMTPEQRAAAVFDEQDHDRQESMIDASHKMYYDKDQENAQKDRDG